ncbi:hypothetical protein TRFO_31786 [Tritrichomonas foetus]|uniref:Uncharacterized protein n=1 Tax=Tritrichomonas foetus TaxID=1144522 RepID=A0A1J4JRN6_9EUKA|nr:hypothetical protein TRFO_31786 [Tritrichomonas foetus]|eukprot:OHT01410.1 hypothetical protein TRFO_31786 [Tritrichomonas foetus]
MKGINYNCRGKYHKGPYSNKNSLKQISQEKLSFKVKNQEAYLNEIRFELSKFYRKYDEKESVHHFLTIISCILSYSKNILTGKISHANPQEIYDGSSDIIILYRLIRIAMTSSNKKEIQKTGISDDFLDILKKEFEISDFKEFDFSPIDEFVGNKLSSYLDEIFSKFIENPNKTFLIADFSQILIKNSQCLIQYQLFRSPIKITVHRPMSDLFISSPKRVLLFNLNERNPLIHHISNECMIQHLTLGDQFINNPYFTALLSAYFSEKIMNFKLFKSGRNKFIFYMLGNQLYFCSLQDHETIKEEIKAAVQIIEKLLPFLCRSIMVKYHDEIATEILSLGGQEYTTNTIMIGNEESYVPYFITKNIINDLVSEESLTELANIEPNIRFVTTGENFIYKNKDETNQSSNDIIIPQCHEGAIFKSKHLSNVFVIRVASFNKIPLNSDSKTTFLFKGQLTQNDVIETTIDTINSLLPTIAFSFQSRICLGITFGQNYKQPKSFPNLIQSQISSCITKNKLVKNIPQLPSQINTFDLIQFSQEIKNVIASIVYLEPTKMTLSFLNNDYAILELPFDKISRGANTKSIENEIKKFFQSKNQSFTIQVSKLFTPTIVVNNLKKFHLSPQKFLALIQHQIFDRFKFAIINPIRYLESNNRKSSGSIFITCYLPFALAVANEIKTLFSNQLKDTIPFIFPAHMVHPSLLENLQCKQIIQDWVTQNSTSIPRKIDFKQGNWISKSAMFTILLNDGDFISLGDLSPEEIAATKCRVIGGEKIFNTDFNTIFNSVKKLKLSSTGTPLPVNMKYILSKISKEIQSIINRKIFIKQLGTHCIQFVIPNYEDLNSLHFHDRIKSTIDKLRLQIKQIYTTNTMTLSFSIIPNDLIFIKSFTKVMKNNKYSLFEFHPPKPPINSNILLTITKIEQGPKIIDEVRQLMDWWKPELEYTTITLEFCQRNFQGSRESCTYFRNLLMTKPIILPYSAVPISGISLNTLLTLTKPSSWKISEAYKCLIVPVGEEEEEAIEFMKTHKKDSKTKVDSVGCALLCDEDNPIFLDNLINIYQRDGTILQKPLCIPCMIDYLNFLVQPFFHSISEKLNSEYFNGLTNPIQFIPTVSSEIDKNNGTVWPQIPLSQFLYNLLTSHNHIELKILTQVWFTGVVLHSLHSSPLTTFCPEHPQYIFEKRHVNSEKVVSCQEPGCSLKLCSICESWHKDSDLCPQWIKTIGKECPHCKNRIIKSSGCNHITCICRMHWCYACPSGESPYFSSSGPIYQHMNQVHHSIYS